MAEDEEHPAPAVAVAVAEPAEPEAAPETPMAEAAAAHAERADAAASHAAEAAIVTAGLAEAAAAERIATFEERLDQCQTNVGGLADRVEALAALQDSFSSETSNQLSQILERLAPPPEPLTSPPTSRDDATPPNPNGEPHQAESQPEPAPAERKRAHRWI